MRKVDFVFFDAGGGHRAAATALQTVVQQQNRPWEIRMVNLQEVMDPLDIFRKFTGVRLQDIYNRMLANGWTLGSGYLLPGMHGIIRMYHPAQVKMLSEFWRSRAPDLVVSVVPNFNRALLQGLRRSPSRAPYVTILTDFADFPPHFWIERQDQFLICGTDRAVSQARRMGYPPDRLFRVSGMILRPTFYCELTHDRNSELRKLGLDPNRATGLVLFGGQGSAHMLRIAELLQDMHRDVQLILICGRNEKLAAELRDMNSHLRMHVVGFTHEVPYYMSLCDFFIGKPGPGSISEALAMKLPVIIERNAWTLPQERYNAEWVRRHEVGLVVRSFRKICTAVEQMLEPETFERLRRNAECVRNRAVFEIPEILNRIVERHG
ncbi:MAG: galactosyldiacylglycerol synthase [Bryobacteraceae bacterium]|nr:galactosyldiacylglycerol synthase [Bryobacteraceae bacterium]